MTPVCVSSFLIIHTIKYLKYKWKNVKFSRCHWIKSSNNKFETSLFNKTYSWMKLIDDAKYYQAESVYALRIQMNLSTSKVSTTCFFPYFFNAFFMMRHSKENCTCYKISTTNSIIARLGILAFQSYNIYISVDDTIRVGGTLMTNFEKQANTTKFQVTHTNG